MRNDWNPSTNPTNDPAGDRDRIRRSRGRRPAELFDGDAFDPRLGDPRFGGPGFGRRGAGRGRGGGRGARDDDRGFDGRGFGPGPGFGGPGGPGFGRGFGGWDGPVENLRGMRSMGRARARRGDIRVAMLALLLERPMHGYEMITELNERTGGAWSPSPGSIYPKLQLLEDEGLIEGDDSDGKRRYRLTDAGRAKAEERQGPAPWEQVGAGMPQGVLALREAVGTLVPAVFQVAQVGDDAQRAAAVEVLADARRRIYELLAAAPAPQAEVAEDDPDAEDDPEA